MLDSLYLKSQCPKCKAANWVFWDYLLNPDDSRPLTDAIECRQCHFLWLIDEDTWFDEHIWTILDDALESCKEAGREDFDEIKWANEKLALIRQRPSIQDIIREHAFLETGRELS